MSISDTEFLFVPRDLIVITEEYPLVCCLKRQTEIVVGFLETYTEIALDLIEEAYHLAQYHEMICCITLYKKKNHILHELTCNDKHMFKKQYNSLTYLQHIDNMVRIAIIIPNSL